MRLLRTTTLAALALVAPAAYAQPANAGFESPITTYGAGYGAALTQAASVGATTPVEGSVLGLLTANESCSAGSPVTCPNNFLQPAGAWQYAPYSGLGLPGATATGSVRVSDAFSFAADGTFSVAFNFFSRAILTTDDASGLPQYRNWSFARLLQNGSAVATLFQSQVTGDAQIATGDGVLFAGTPGVTLTPLAGVLPGGVANGEYGWESGWYRATLDVTAGTGYQLELGVATEYEKSANAALGVDDVQFAPTATVPEPGTWALLATGLVGIAGMARRRRR